MAGPLADKILLPSDVANAGKKVRTQTKVIGSDIVHTHFFIEERQASVINVYRYAQAQNTVLAAAQNGTTAGMLFCHMPSTVPNKAARLRRLAFTSQHSTALATPTAPRLVVQRFTSAGALTTGLITAALVNPDLATHALLLSAVNTGTTVVLGAPVGAAALAGALTAVGAYEPCYKDFIDPASDEDEWPIFKAGQGFVIYQDQPGTAADTRKFNLQLMWDEIDIA